jgi:hypothetical protein
MTEGIHKWMEERIEPTVTRRKGGNKIQKYIIMEKAMHEILISKTCHSIAQSFLTKKKGTPQCQKKVDKNF